MKKRTKSFLLKAVLVALCLSTFALGFLTLGKSNVALADEEPAVITPVEITPDYSWYTSAEATEYSINSASQLVALSNITKGNVVIDQETTIQRSNFAGKTIRLTADIAFGENEYWYFNDGTSTPINHRIGLTGANAFAGTFDGTKTPAEGETPAETYVISGLKMFNSDLTTGNRDPQVGLFAEIASTGVVSNLTLDGVTAELSGYDRFGFIAITFRGSAENCHVKNANVSIAVDNGGRGYTSQSGSMFAYVGSATISNCSSETFRLKCFGTDNSDHVGALIGYVSGSLENRSTISNCWVNDVQYECTRKTKRTGGFVGNADNADFINCSATTINIFVETYYQGIGGFVGNAGGNSTYTDCEVVGFTMSCGDTATIAGDVGGFAGLCGSSVKFLRSSVEELNMDLISDNNGWGNGGFIGWQSGSNVVIETCSTAGQISVNGNATEVASGGFIGYSDNNSIKINDCSTAVDVSSNTTAGGFVGDSKGGDFSNCQATGSVNSSDGMAGGWIGYTHPGADITFNECEPSTSISGSTTNSFANATDGNFNLDSNGEITFEPIAYKCFGYIDGDATCFYSMESAIDAGLTSITLLGDIEEDFTIDKKEASSFTINLKEYTLKGKITITNNVKIKITGTSEDNNIELGTPIKDNHYFAGWYHYKDTNVNSEEQSFDGNVITIPNGKVFYAKFAQSSYAEIPEFDETNQDQDRTFDFGSITYGESAPTSQSLTFVYNGETEEIPASITSIEQNPYFDTSYNELTATVTPKANLNAGNYQEFINVQLHDGSTYNIIAKIVVQPKDISNAVITLGNALTYNGREQIQTITSVILGGENVTYNVSDNKATNVKTDGDYILTVTGNGNFSGSITTTWNIAKSNAIISVDQTPIVKTYGEVWELPTATSNFGTVVCDKVIADLENVNTYTVTYSVAGTSNYNGDAKTISVTINKSNAIISVDQTPIVKTYGEVWELPTATSNFGTVVCDKVIADLENVGEYTVTYSVIGTSNYNGDTKTISVTINKATFDMSGITFEDKTVDYDGQAKSIEISGILPSGVTVEYLGNSNTEAGVYTITARFICDTTNYNEIAPMTATLTINNVKMVSHLTDANGKPVVIITGENGFAPNVEIVATEIPAKEVNAGDSLKGKEEVLKAFDISLKVNDSEIQPNGKVTVKILIPEELRDKEFRLIHNHQGTFTEVSYTVEGDYLVFTTDEFSQFIFVGENAPNLLLIILLVVAGGLAILLTVKIIISFRKKKELTEDVEEIENIE